MILLNSYPVPGHFSSNVAENGPGLGPKHDTLNFTALSMIIYIGKFNLQNNYAISRFVDHLIDIFIRNLQLANITYCKAKLEILYRIHIALNITQVWPIENLSHSKYNVLIKKTLHTNMYNCCFSKGHIQTTNLQC